MMRLNVMRSMLVCAAFVAMAARASLPPLPADMPFDDALTPAGRPPLPRVVTTDVANPFTPDGTDEAAAPGRDADASADAAQPSSTARNEAEPKRQAKRARMRSKARPSRSRPPRV